MDDPAVVERMMTSGDYSPNYRRNLVAGVRSWAQFRKDSELLARLEDIRLPPPVPRGAREALSLDEWQKVRDAIAQAPYLAPPRKHVCAIIATRGIRCGDVLRLRHSDIAGALDTGILAYEAKGERWLRYSARPLLQHLQGLADCKWPPKGRVRNLVCPRSRADRCQDTAGREIRRSFDRIAQDLGMPPEDLYAHRFRHTYSTHFLRQMKGDPEAIFKLQQQMGWSRLDTAANYLRGSRREELDELEKQLLSGVDE